MTGSAAYTAESETQRAIREEWCNSCHRPKREWGPVCPSVYVGDWTHFHSPEFWRLREPDAPPNFRCTLPDTRSCPECGRDLRGYRGPLCRYCDGTAE